MRDGFDWCLGTIVNVVLDRMRDGETSESGIWDDLSFPTIKQFQNTQPRHIHLLPIFCRSSADLGASLSDVPSYRAWRRGEKVRDGQKAVRFGQIVPGLAVRPFRQPENACWFWHGGIPEARRRSNAEKHAETPKHR